MQFQQELTAIKNGLMAQYPNLNPDDYLEYVALEFSLENTDHLDELAHLSNGYIELKGDILTMSVTKLENLRARASSSNSSKRPLSDAVKHGNYNGRPSI
jgi:hypothetical protein